MNTQALESAIGCEFKNKELLLCALTHSSYGAAASKATPDNERLEFFGDAILEFCVSEYLFEKYPDMDEGQLTRIRARSVCESALYAAALSLELGSYLRLSKGERQSGGQTRPSILSDALEALIAAVYLDSGIEAARRFVLSFAPVLVDRAVGGSLKDNKTLLQEYLQRDGSVDIEYAVLSESGPEHSKSFECCVCVGTEVLGKGTGSSKKRAEQSAARAALEKLTGQSGGEY